MVKQADKDTRRNPLLPVFGLLLAAGLFAIAYFLSSTYIIHNRYVLSIMGAPSVKNAVIFAIGVWVILLAMAYFLVAVLVGKSPDAPIPLPPKKKSKSKQ